MMWTSHRRACCLLVILLCPVAPAWGLAAEPPVVCATTPPCSEGFTKAQHLAKEGRPEQALAAFLALYADFPDPRLCFPIGRMLQRQGQNGQAASYYRLLIDSGVETDPDKLAIVRTYLAEAQAALERGSPSVLYQPEVRAGVGAPATVPPASPPPQQSATEASRFTGPPSSADQLSQTTRLEPVTAPPKIGPSRTRWFLGVGIPLSALGGAVLGLGIAVAAVDGSCAQTIQGIAGPECDRRYASRTAGITIAAEGAVMLVGGIGFLAAGRIAYGRWRRAALAWSPAFAPTGRANSVVSDDLPGGLHEIH